MKRKFVSVVLLLVLIVQGVGFAQEEDADYWIEWGLHYYNQGDYINSIDCFLKLKNILEQTIGIEHIDYATCLGNLGWLYREIGDYTISIHYYLNAINILNIQELILGNGHQFYANLLNNLGELYYLLGDYTEAERYFLDVHFIENRILGSDHPNYATTLNNLGVVYYNMGDYIRAKDYLLAAKTIRENNKEHPDYTQTINNLGALYLSLGDFNMAESYLLETISIEEKILGTNHPDYASELAPIKYTKLSCYVA